MKKILFLLLIFLFVGFVRSSLAQNTYYSKSTMTTFNTLADWGLNTDGTGSNPGSISNSDNFIVSNNATVTGLGASVSVRNLTINAGSTLTLNSTNTVTATVASNGVITVNGTLNVNGSVASQINANALTINNGGSVTNSSSVGSGQPITVSGAFTINDGGTYTHTVARSANIGGSKSFSNNSNFVYTNYGAFLSSVTYGNLRMNGSGTVTINSASGMTINGTLRVSLGTVNLQSTNTASTTIGGGLLVDGGTLTGSTGAGVSTIIFANAGLATGNLTVSSGTFSPQNITINTSRTVGLGSNVAIPTSRTLTVNGTLDCSTFAVTGAGAFTLSTNGTLKLGNTAGLSSTASTGAIQVTGTRTYNATGVTIEYNGSSAQNTGNQFPASLKNFTVSNAAGVTLDASATISGTANVTGLLQLGTNNMTQTGGAATLSGTGTIKLDGVLNTQIGTYSSNTFQTNGTYQFNGTNQDVPSGSYKNITVNGGDAQLTGNVSLSGVLAVNGTLTLGANKLTFTGSSPTRTAEGIDASNTNAEIEFNSAGTITLPASLFTGDIGKLTMTGSGLVTSSDNINVTNALTLTNGFLNMGANTLTLGTSTSNEGTYSRTSGTIRGTFKRWIASGASTKEFPLDNGSGALSMATVTFTSLGTGGTLTAKFNNSGSGTLSDNGGLGYLATGPSMSNVNLINLAPQYWTITAGDGLATPNYSIDITGDGVPNISEINYIAIVKRADNTQPWAWNSGNHSTTTGSTSNPILHGVSFTSFSEFGVGGNVDNLLPVELSSFTSAVAGRNVTLSWSTGNEQNNSGFDIERKSTVTEWVKIGNVEGHGTVNTPNSYSFNDNALSSGRYSYRLKQIDYNGNFRYYYLSNEINIGAPSKYSLSQNYPNPFNPVTTISYEIPNADFVALKVYDMTGKEVASLVNEKQDAGFYSIRFDASRLSSGVYFYTLKSSDFVSTKKLILVK